jgi:hypothetical protein
MKGEAEVKFDISLLSKYFFDLSFERLFELVATTKDTWKISKKKPRQPSCVVTPPYSSVMTA